MWQGRHSHPRSLRGRDLRLPGAVPLRARAHQAGVGPLLQQGTHTSPPEDGAGRGAVGDAHWGRPRGHAREADGLHGVQAHCLRAGVRINRRPHARAHAPDGCDLPELRSGWPVRGHRLAARRHAAGLHEHGLFAEGIVPCRRGDGRAAVHDATRPHAGMAGVVHRMADTDPAGGGHCRHTAAHLRRHQTCRGHLRPAGRREGRGGRGAA
mmetsp:Transcript_112742/g.349938  ORF Transcript_112742/g.349938 Transcript_112742/m.349938 type:complete len:210 (+) Transcript_112742:286-915(+)